MRNFQSSGYFRRSNTISSHFNDALSSFLTQRATINKFPTKLICILSTWWRFFGFRMSGWWAWSGTISTVDDLCVIFIHWTDRAVWYVRHILTNNLGQMWSLRVFYRFLDWSGDYQEWNSCTCLIRISVRDFLGILSKSLALGWSTPDDKDPGQN